MNLLFNFYSPGKARFYPSTYNVFKREITKIIAILDSKELLALDVGCNSGQYSLLLESMGITCIGLDFSTNALKKAKLAKLQVIRASATALPFKEECFSLTVCLELLFHLTDNMLNMALDETKRVLKRNGWFLSDVKNSLNPFLIISYKINANQGCPLKARNLFKTMKKLRSIGYHRCQAFVIPYPFVIPNFLKAIAPKILITASLSKNHQGTIYKTNTAYTKNTRNK